MNNNTKSRRLHPRRASFVEPTARPKRERYGDNLPKVGRSGPAISKHINNVPTWGP